MLLLVGDDAHRESADACVSAKHSLAVLRFVLVEAAAIDDSSQDFTRVVGTSGRRIVNTVDFFCGIRGLFRLLTVPNRLPAITPFFDQRADARDAGFVVGFAIIHCAADGSMHSGTAQ